MPQTREHLCQAGEVPYIVVFINSDMVDDEELWNWLK